MSSLNDKNKNEIIKLFTDDITIVSSIFRTILGLIIEIVFTFVSSIIMSLIFDWRIGLICIGFILILLAMIMKYYNWNSKLQVDTISNDYFSETIANIKLIKAFNLRENLLKFLISEEKKIKTRAAAYNHILHYVGYGISSFTVYIQLAILNYIGGIFIIEQKITTVSSFTGSSSLLFIYLIITTLIWKYLSDFFYINQSLSKLNVLISTKVSQFISKANAGSINKEISENNTPARYEEVSAAYAKAGDNNKLDTNLLIKNKKNIKGKVEFKNVSFSYSTEKNKNKVLNNLSFVSQPGLKIGFVGPSGSGKSTIIQLLLRFYEPSEGEIYLDDINIKDFDIKEIRDYFSGVFQEPDLFERSIYENIHYGNLNASQEEIIAAALIAQIPLTLLDDKNKQSIMQISGGQKQRVAIARCLLKKRNIYFFDEATSALDLDTEKKIIYNLDNYFDNLEYSKTILIVAHR